MSDTPTDEELICDCGDLLEVKLTERLKGMKPGQERRFAYQLAMLLRQRERAAKREILEHVKLETDRCICDCGEPWNDTDLADWAKEELAKLDEEAKKLEDEAELREVRDATHRVVEEYGEALEELGKE